MAEIQQYIHKHGVQALFEVRAAVCSLLLNAGPDGPRDPGAPSKPRGFSDEIPSEKAWGTALLAWLVFLMVSGSLTCIEWRFFANACPQFFFGGRGRSGTVSATHPKPSLIAKGYVAEHYTRCGNNRVPNLIARFGRAGRPLRRADGDARAVRLPTLPCSPRSSATTAPQRPAARLGSSAGQVCGCSPPHAHFSGHAARTGC
jgi:hypothetical protein